MSWSYSNIETEQSEVDLRAKIEALQETSAIDKQQPAAPEEAHEELEAAIQAAVSIFESEALGEGDVRVSLAGHANPGHEPESGFATDGVSISIYRIPVTPEASGTPAEEAAAQA